MLKTDRSIIVNLSSINQRHSATTSCELGGRGAVGGAPDCGNGEWTATVCARARPASRSRVIASGSSYGYSGSSLPLGVSFSASYLNPGGSYSTHSSLGGYGRAPLSSRWISSSRAYSPMLSTISERGTSSPVRINSPRRIPLTNKTYSSTSYSPRPRNINTADIDVSRDKYRAKHALNRPPVSPTTSGSLDSKHGTNNSSNDNGPFMPRVDGKPETGIDSSPGQRSTIHRGRTVVRLYTVKRKERDSPRKAQDTENTPQQYEATKSIKNASVSESRNIEESVKKQSSKTKISKDTAHKEKNQKKPGVEKNLEKFKSKEEEESSNDITVKKDCSDQGNIENCNVLQSSTMSNTDLNKSLDRRCSMELLAEQAHLLDSLIRNENLSTATLDLSKLGTKDDKTQIFNFSGNANEKTINEVPNRLQTTKSDHSLHNRLKSSMDSKEFQHLPKRRSLKKSSSGGNIRRLDSITEFSKESLQNDLPVIEENRLSCKSEILKTKPKLKPKITSSVETSQPASPLKFRVENIIVEEKVKMPKKEIIFSSAVDIPSDESKLISITNETVNEFPKNQKISSKTKKIKPVLEKRASSENSSEDCDFWDKIGKRETIYIKKRKEKIENDILQHRKEIFWSPEEESEIDNRNEQTCHLDVLLSQNEQKCSEVPHLNLNPTENCAVVDIEPGNNNNSVEAIKPETVRNEEIILLGIKKDESDHLKMSSKDVLENSTHKTQLDCKPLPDTIDVHNAAIQEQNANNTMNVINIENDVKSECQSLTSLVETVQENGTGHSLFDKEIEIEAITQPITEVISNKQTDIIEKVSNLEKVLQREEIVYNTMDLTKSSSVNTTVLDAKVHNAKITIVDEPKILNKNQLPSLTSCKIPKPESIPNGPVSDELVLEQNNIGKNCEESANINDASKLSVPNNSIANNIPNKNGPLHENSSMTIEGTGETNKADNLIPENGSTNVNVSNEKSENGVVQLLVSPKKRLVKDEPALRPLIATPRPLQKKNPQVIHSSTSSESSSEEESSDDDNDDDDADESEDSEESAQFYDCENNPDGRTSTGSNDSGFDSSAPTSPAGFVFIKKKTFPIDIADLNNTTRDMQVVTTAPVAPVAGPLSTALAIFSSRNSSLVKVVEAQIGRYCSSNIRTCSARSQYGVRPLFIKYTTENVSGRLRAPASRCKFTWIGS
ncbi:hypothetical protein EVAR_83900_1 [Eumeta japonica]|uniref:Uncharacterized protein n=1 Tax=Eumeta variegata TaxID=151549 RepID=A0A4C1US06_EUMVA|nr:hypothetical protein EVAR_83900_1 [Eumeta japonica]